MSKLNIDKTDFKKFLNCLEKINSSVILNIDKNGLTSIASSKDKSLFLLVSLEKDFNFTSKLNLPSVKKLSDCLDLIPKQDIELIINTNNIEYNDNNVKFKYHLYDDGILMSPRLSMSKIQSLKYEYEFDVNTSFITSLLSNSHIFSESKKIYIYTEDGHLMWSLADKTQMNTDNLVVRGAPTNYDIEETIINIDNFKLISFDKSSDFKLRINKDGVVNIQLKNGNNMLNYIISSLKK